MTDIEKLRDEVIDAARAWERIQRGFSGESAALDRLEDSIKTLEEAEKPDPWSLLREARDQFVDDAWENNLDFRIEQALEWREKNG